MGSDQTTREQNWFNRDHYSRLTINVNRWSPIRGPCSRQLVFTVAIMLQFATVKLNQHSFDNGKQTFVIGHRAKRWFCRTPRHHCTKYYDSFTSCCCCTPPYVRLTSPHRDTLAQQRSATLFLPQSHSLSLSLSPQELTLSNTLKDTHTHPFAQEDSTSLSTSHTFSLSYPLACHIKQAGVVRSFSLTKFKWALFSKPTVLVLPLGPRKKYFDLFRKGCRVRPWQKTSTANDWSTANSQIDKMRT